MKRKDTTFLIHETMLNRLEKASEKTKKKPNEILLYLLNRIMEHNEEFHLQHDTIVYQDKIGDYLTHHIYLSEKEYEFKLDIRRFFKMSFSLAIAKSMSLYLSKYIDLVIFKGSSCLIDNENQYSFHKISANFLKNHTRYTILWSRAKTLKYQGFG